MSKLIVFGCGDIARLADFYFETDSDHEVVAFTVDEAYVPAAKEFCGKPVVPFEVLENTYPPPQYQIFIALSYSKMNRIKEKKFFEAKAKGYSFASYVSSKCSYLSQYPPGENSFIL